MDRRDIAPLLRLSGGALLLRALGFACSALSLSTPVATPCSLSRPKAAIPCRDRKFSVAIETPPSLAKLCHDINHYCDTGPAEPCCDREELCCDPGHPVCPRAVLRHRRPCRNSGPALSNTRAYYHSCTPVART